MPDPKSKARVERLLHGEFHTEDLSHLFLYARDHCDGRESVVDIGAFIAHHSERDRGITTRSTQEWFTVARFHMSRLRADGVHPIDVTRMPAATRDYFAIAVNRMDAKDIREKAKLRRAKADAIMQGIVERLVHNPDSTWALPSNLSRAVDLIVCVSSMMVVKPAFTAERLYDDFIATLKSNGLISKEDERSHRDMLRAVVQLYAVAAMHHCIVQVGDGTTVQLKAGPEPDSTAKQITVLADIPILPVEKGTIAAAASMFTAELDPTDHCQPELLANQNWDFEIELARDRRLARL